MNGEAHWLDPLVVVVGGLAIVAFIAIAVKAGQVLRRLQLRLTCPRTGEEVDARVVEDVGAHRFTEVERCSGAADPDDVRCDRKCLEKLNRETT